MSAFITIFILFSAVLCYFLFVWQPTTPTTPTTPQNNSTTNDSGEVQGNTDSSLYFSEIYGVYGEDEKCNDGDITLAKDIRKDIEGEYIHLCGKHSDTTSGVNKIQTYVENCPDSTDWKPVYIYKDNSNTNDLLDLRKDDRGKTYRLCYQSSTPGKPNITVAQDFKCNEKDEAISFAGDEYGTNSAYYNKNNFMYGPSLITEDGILSRKKQAYFCSASN